MCRLCGSEIETLEHAVKRCSEMAKWEEEVDKLLGEKAEGLEWVREWRKKVESKKVKVG